MPEHFGSQGSQRFTYRELTERVIIDIVIVGALKA